MSTVNRVRIGQNHKSAEVLNQYADSIVALSGLNVGETFPGFATIPAVAGKLDMYAVQSGELGVTSTQYPVGDVRRYGAVGNGVTNDTAAFQAAHDTGYSVIIPPTNACYVLSTPVLVDQGFHFYGEASRRGMNGGTAEHAAILAPVTAAFAPRVPLTQMVAGTIAGLGFQGGTTQVDLGLCHEATVEDCTFRGFSKAGLCIVRGEKQKLSRLRFDFTVASVYGIGFGYKASVNYNGSTYGGQVPATFFGAPDAWTDRVEMESITFQSGGVGLTWTTAAITGRIISNIHATNFVWHGAGAGDGKLWEVDVRMQQCHFDTHTIDSINTTGAAAIGYDIPQTNNSVFTNIAASFSTNSLFTTAFNIGAAFETTFISCMADGDNATSFGFKFGNGVGQTPTLIGCQGAIFSSGANNLVKGQIKLVGCRFTTTNLPSGSQQTVTMTNEDMVALIMADSNGTLAAQTGRHLFRWASGSGAITEPIRVEYDGLKVAGKVRFDNAFGSVTPQDILVSNGSPEAAVTAISASLCMAYTGTTVGQLWVKKTGSGNTGWRPVIVNVVDGNVGDNAKTLTYLTDGQTQQWGNALTANRAVTLSTTGALNGARFRIVRKVSSTGAFTLDVGAGPLKSLAAGQWCDVEYDGAAWFLTAFGSL